MYSESGHKYCTCDWKKRCLETTEMGLGKYKKDLNSNRNPNDKSGIRHFSTSKLKKKYKNHFFTFDNNKLYSYVLSNKRYQ